MSDWADRSRPYGQEQGKRETKKRENRGGAFAGRRESGRCRLNVSVRRRRRGMRRAGPASRVNASRGSEFNWLIFVVRRSWGGSELHGFAVPRCNSAVEVFTGGSADRGRGRVQGMYGMSSHRHSCVCRAADGALG